MTLPKTEVFTSELFRNISADTDYGNGFAALFEAMVKFQEVALPAMLKTARRIHDAQPIDAVFNDIATFPGFDIANALGVQLFHMFPLTINLTPGMYTHLPPLGSGFGRDMTIGERLVTYAVKLALPFVGISLIGRLNAVRRANDIERPYGAMELSGHDALVLAPTVWGYDIPQPLCPNVFPVGVVSPAPDATPLEPELQRFLDSPYCVDHGAVYVNFGTLAVVSPRLSDEVLLALLNDDAINGVCVVWKVPDTAQRHNVGRTLRDSSQESRFFLSGRFANPRDIMSHATTKVFLTHCGDTSVGEAIEAGVPLVGVPVFADQSDVCRRVAEAGIGVYVGHKATMVAGDITAAIVTVMQSKRSGGYGGGAAPNKFDEAIERTRRWSKAYGGAPRGAEIIERFALLGPDVAKELSCRHLQPGTLHSHPVLELVFLCELDWMLLFLVLPLLLLWLAVMWVCRRVFLLGAWLFAPRKEKFE